MRFLLTVFMLAALPAGAVTLQEAVGIALDSRGDVQSALMSFQSAGWESRNADLWFLPQVSGQLAFSRNFDVQELSLPGIGTIPMGSEYTSLAGITVSIPIFVAQGPAGSRMASRAEDLSMHQARAAEMDAVVEVVRAFYGVLLASEMMDVSREALDIAEEGYRLAELKYTAGTISRFELLQSRVAWENRQPGLISAENALENSLVGFSVALGQDGDDLFQIEGDLDRHPDLKLPVSLEDAREMMLENSPDLQSAEYMQLVGEAGVDMARASFMPQLVFQTGLNYQAARSDMDFEIDDYERNLTASVSLQVPLFNGFSDIAGFNSARAQRTAAMASARSVRQFAELSLVSAWNNLQAAQESADATCSTVEQAMEGVEIARVSYEAGMITRLDMDQAFLALTTARTNHASALFSLRIAEAELMRSVGIMEGYINE
ncbi:MAG: TolC family protein [Candidatus Fermentibacteraceae bacterium]|nr:TolC family protein [Candidatus Fermentibacteraceae bacterium]